MFETFQHSTNYPDVFVYVMKNSFNTLMVCASCRKISKLSNGLFQLSTSIATHNNGKLTFGTKLEMRTGIGMLPPCTCLI